MRGLILQEHGKSGGMYPEALIERGIMRATGEDDGQGGWQFASVQEHQALFFLNSRRVKGTENVEGLSPTFRGRLAALFQAAPPEVGQYLGIYSARRSRAHQQALWDASDKTGHMVARPGNSRHEFGNAVDLAYRGKSLRHAPPEVLRWVHQNARYFGLTFPMSWEPWHIEPIEGRQEKQGGGPAVGV